MKMKHISLSTIALAALSGAAAGFGPAVPGPARPAPEFTGMPVGWSLLNAWDGFGQGAAAPHRHEDGRQDACFDEGTEITPEMMDNLNALRSMGSDDPFGTRFNPNGNNRNSWPHANTPVVLTYSYVPDGTPMERTTLRRDNADYVIEVAASSLFSNLDARFGGNRELWMYEIDSVFQRYTELTGVTFVRVGDDGASHPSSPGVAGVRGDIRIGLRPVDGGSGILAFAGSHVTLDAAENWGDFANSFIRLRNVMSHEVGHALGLGHTCPLNHTKLMEPIYTPDFDGPRHDDIRGLHAIYGDAFEPNNFAGSAHAMTDSLPQTSFTFFNYPYSDGAPGATTASISGGQDVDWYRSFLGARMPVSVTVAPGGATYDDSDQLGDGSCSAGTFITTFNACRLGVALYAADGTTLLATALAPAAGQPATLSGVSVPGGNYYTLVYCPDGGSFGPQGYTLTRSIGSPQPPANDLCASAQPFIAGPVYGTTFGAGAEGSATLDIGGASDPFNTRGDVFYTFTASHTGRLETFTTNAGSPPGSGQAVTLHTGCQTSRNNQLSIPDTNHYGMGSMYSDVVAGQTYTVRIGSAPNREWGGFTLDQRYLNAPPNDRCENAQAVTGGTYAGTTNFARREAGQSCAATANSPTVWYSYTAPYTNTVHLTTCGSGWDTVMAAYDSCPPDFARPLACNDDSPCGNYPYTSSLDVLVEAGRTIYVRVSGYQGGSGAFTLGVTQGPVVNDGCAGALPISAGTTAFDTTYATTDQVTEAGCSFCCDDLLVNRDLWYAYTAPSNGTLSVNTAGSPFDTKLAAYGACPSGNNQAVACNDDSIGLQSSIELGVQAGRTYLIRVGGYRDAAGAGLLNVAFAPAACPADFNQDGFLDFFDYDDYVNCFESGACPAGRTADFNGDGFADFFDYDDFVAAFETGC